MQQAAEQQQHQIMDDTQEKKMGLEVQEDFSEEPDITSDNDINTDTESETEQLATAVTHTDNGGLASDIEDGSNFGIEDDEEDNDDLDMDGMLKQANEYYLRNQQNDTKESSASLHHDGPCGFAASLEQMEKQSQHLVRGDIRELRERLDQLETRLDTLDLKLNLVTDVLSHLNLIKQEEQQSIMSDMESEQTASESQQDVDNVDNAMQQCEQKCVSDTILGSGHCIQPAVLEAKKTEYNLFAKATSEAGSTTSYLSSGSDLSSAGF